MPRDTCALCLTKAPLRRSHIVPSFFGAYLKETSATGYLRGGSVPNLRKQDLLTEELLCNACEGRFAVWKKDFKELALEKVQHDRYTELDYGPWLLRFIVSVSWRVLVAGWRQLATERPRLSSLITSTSENWRLFLLDARKHPGTEHHLFVVAGSPVSISADAHEKTLHYLLRSIDAGTGGNGRTFFVYTKALRSLIFSPIVPSSPRGWINTRVHTGCGKLISPQAIAMPGFGEFLSSRVRDSFSETLSERQRTKITEAVLRNPERALSSESYEVHKATQRLITNRKTKDGW